MTATKWLAVLLVAEAVAQPAFAQGRHAFDIAAGRLSDAVVAVGVQGGVSIGLSDPTAQMMNVRAVHGRLSVDAALRHMLAGTGLRAIRIDDRTYMIAADGRRPARAEPVQPPAVEAVDEIIVTASKRNTRLRDFAGSIAMLDATAEGLNDNAHNGTQAIVDAMPSLASTHLGPGRNKLIIRGISDSSFTGPTQAIVGQYLGEVRLNYNAPDPNLNLYDMQRIEILEGPQGTLYGAGSLGGIVRLVPNPADLSTSSGSIAGGLGSTDGGGRSNDIAAMINLPVDRGIIGIRAVGYRTIDGGYIRDAQRGLDHINRSKTEGGRLSVRIDAGNGWMVDLGATLQDINNADSQYAERGLPPYTRRSAIAQPFDNDYRLGQVVVTKNWGDLRLLSAIGVVRHDVDEIFDATPPNAPTPRVFHQYSHVTLFSNENRLSRQRADGTGWLIGTSVTADSERQTRDLGDVAAPLRIAGIHNAVTQGAVYGEASLGLLPRLVVTAGGRLAYSGLSGEPTDVVGDKTEPSRTEIETLPSLAFNWRPLPGVTAYLRYQEGFRPGGLSVSSASTGVISQRFQGDSIATYETGLRFHDSNHDRFAASFNLSFAHWEHIQADLVNGSGLPFTANIGNGRIYGFEANVSWMIVDGLRIEGGAFVNDSRLTRPDPGFEDARHADLPNVARLGARGSFSYDRKLRGDWVLSARGSVRYFGHSRLGVGPLLDFRQGNYGDTALSARIGPPAYGISLDVSNLLNKAKNRFSLGNPFGVMDGTQITPQQPRTIRIGLDAKF